MKIIQVICKYCGAQFYLFTSETRNPCQKCKSSDFETKTIETVDTYSNNPKDQTPIDTYEGAPAFPPSEEDEDDPYYGIW